MHILPLVVVVVVVVVVVATCTMLNFIRISTILLVLDTSTKVKVYRRVV